MKTLTACVVTCIVLIVLMAGCTSQLAPKPSTPGTSAVPVTINPTPVPARVPDPSLVGTWYLTMMTGPGGVALTDAMSPQITLVFTNQSNVIGFSGCNNYHGHYTLAGQVLPDGNGITIGPLASTTMYCANGTNTEMTYLEALPAAKTVTLSTKQELTIRDNRGYTFDFQKTPFSATFVPKGF